MNQFSDKIQRLLLAFLISIFFVAIVNAQTDEKSLILKNCTDLFGAPVDAKMNLFEINSDYVLELRFNLQGRLNDLAFFPKYDLPETHPEWKRPQGEVFLSQGIFLPKAEYEDLLRRLDKISPKGELIKSMPNKRVHGFSTDTLDQYEHAFLFRNEPIGTSGGVYVGILYFFHEVEGRVGRKDKYNWFIPRDEEDYYYQVSVGKRNHFVRKEDYLKLRIGRAAKFLAFGPIEGICDVRNCNPLRQHNNSFNRTRK